MENDIEARIHIFVYIRTPLLLKVVSFVNNNVNFIINNEL